MAVSDNCAWAVTASKVEMVIQRLISDGQPRKIYLFGSHVSGQTHRHSDLDVLVVAPDAVENTRKESARLRGAVRDVHMPIDILVVRESAFERLKDAIGLIYREVLSHGRLVYDADART